MANLKNLKGGWQAMRAKIDELIERVNALSNTSVSRVDSEEVGELLTVSGTTSILQLKEQAGSGGGGGVLIDGWQIYWADGTSTFIPFDTAMDGYDPDTDTARSIEFGVNGSVFDKTIDYNTSIALYNGDASADPVEAQTFYRLPVVRGSNRLTFGGAYRENIFCAGNKGPIVELVKIA